MPRIAKALVVLAGAGLIATQARGQAVTVIGEGLARQCSQAALAGESDHRSEQLCSNALTFEPLDRLDRAGTLVNRGVMKLRRKEFASAQLDFDSAIRAMPEFGEAYMNRGAARLGARKFTDSLVDINRALELGVREPEKAFYNRALAYEGLGLQEIARQDYQQALTLKPEWEQPRRELTRFTPDPR
ncbi:tetratricopeptide repeat protein [Phenylobacterium sp.]|uniref:tetratricopeptide repeat protein n=1 Tax=Phenylobacterium sp. TaxID=1871053 RepID=UPI002FC614AC